MTKIPRARRVVMPFVAVWVIATATACRKSERMPGIAIASSATSHVPDAVQRDSILAAEYARDEAAISIDALSNHDVRLRRLAARALARIAGDGAAKRLEKGLSDEDPTVVAWSAYGLGFACRGREEETVKRLAARLPSLPDQDGNTGTMGSSADVSAVAALTDALARCGGSAAERTLVATLGGPAGRSHAAALALGRLAGTAHRLSDEAIVSLLDRAALADPEPAALYPLSRLDSLSDSAQKRLVELARAALSVGGERRTFAIRALGSAGESAAQLLADVFTDGSYSAMDRSAAALALGRLGASGKPALAAALVRIVQPDTPIDERFVSQHFSPVVAALSTALFPNEHARAPLSHLADAPMPDAITPSLRRRIVQLRCAAASVLAGTASRSVKLIACDPDEGDRTGALADLRVLDRGELKGARFEAWQKLAVGTDPGVRRAALALIPTHPEIPVIVDLLAHAIGAAEPGVAAQAARVVAIEPRRASRGSLLGPPPRADGASETDPGAAASPKIVDALAHAMDADRPPDQIEPRLAFMDAASALGNLSLKSRIERYCTSDNVTVRAHAEKALSLFAHAKAACPPAKRAGPRIREPVPPDTKPTTLTFVTDAGRLTMTLDGRFAPLAVSRIVSLARSGFYDGIRIHRVTPGFVVQFGDPVGDGSGGDGQPPLACETAPIEFSSFSVGIALSGRDTGSSQVFVTLSPEPYLDGDYTEIGRADPEWSLAAEGDVIERVEVR